MRVIIIGGGIGGLCLAQGLSKAGVDVAVYERDRHPAERVDRYRLYVNPAGSRALRACLPDSAWQDFLTGAGEPGGGFGFLTERLRTLVVVDDAIMYPETTDPAGQPHPVDRMFLRGVLLSGLDDVVRLGKEFARYTRLPGGGVTAHFTDGTTAAGAVLIGADGVGSAVRRQYLPGRDPVPTGGVGIGWTVFLGDVAEAGVPERLRTGMNMIMAPVPFFLFTSVFRRPGRARAAAGDYLLCALVADQDACPPGVASLDGTALRAAAAAMMAGWHPDLVRLAAEADPGTFGAFPFAAAPPPGTWTSGPVTLLGDAIHSMPPAGGNGANMALRDASLLSRTLAAAARGDTPLPQAIEDYEAEMRDYAFSAVRGALANERLGRNASLAAQSAMRAWFRLCGAVPPLKRAGFGDSWARDARPRPWELGAR